MIALFKNGKFFDYGTKPSASFYVKMGYTVKVMNEREADEFSAKINVRNIWNKLPDFLRKRVAFIIRNDKLTWAQKHEALINTLDTITKRAGRINVVHFRNKKQWTLSEQLIGVWNDIRSLGRFFKDLLTPMTAAQLQMVHA